MAWRVRSEQVKLLSWLCAAVWPHRVHMCRSVWWAFVDSSGGSSQRGLNLRSDWHLLDQLWRSVSTLATVCLFVVPFFSRQSRTRIGRAAQNVAFGSTIGSHLRSCGTPRAAGMIIDDPDTLDCGTSSGLSGARVSALCLLGGVVVMHCWRHDGWVLVWCGIVHVLLICWHGAVWMKCLLVERRHLNYGVLHSELIR